MSLHGNGSARCAAARVLIVDDHPLFRLGLRQMLEQSGLPVCAEAQDAAEALAAVQAHRPEAATVDVSLPGTNGVRLVREMHGLDPHLRIIVLSMHEDALFAERALRAGALGYVNKQEPPAAVVAALRGALGGRVHLSDSATGKIIQRIVSGKPAGQTPLDLLTDRQFEIFQLIGHGLSTGEIAERLGLSAKTIESHRTRIKSKLNLPRSSHLTRQAVQWVVESG